MIEAMNSIVDFFKKLLIWILLSGAIVFGIFTSSISFGQIEIAQYTLLRGIFFIMLAIFLVIYWYLPRQKAR